MRMIRAERVDNLTKVENSYRTICPDGFMRGGGRIFARIKMLD